MNPWDSWTADDWTRHYATAPPLGPAEYATGDFSFDRATQAARERIQEGLDRVERQFHGIADAPGSFVSAVEMKADEAAEKLRQLANEEEAKLEKTVKVVAFMVLGLFGLLALEGQKKR